MVDATRQPEPDYWDFVWLKEYCKVYDHRTAHASLQYVRKWAASGNEQALAVLESMVRRTVDLADSQTILLFGELLQGSADRELARRLKDGE